MLDLLQVQLVILHISQILHYLLSNIPKPSNILEMKSQTIQQCIGKIFSTYRLTEVKSEQWAFFLCAECFNERKKNGNSEPKEKRYPKHKVGGLAVAPSLILSPNSIFEAFRRFPHSPLDAQDKESNRSTSNFFHQKTIHVYDRNKAQFVIIQK